MNTNLLRTNRYQVIRIGNGTIAVICTHRHRWAAALCAGWRDLRTDAATFGCPVRTWHEYRRAPRPYVNGGRIR